MKIAFDIDDTLLLYPKEEDIAEETPNFELITVLKWFYKNGDEIYFWSAGGIDYCGAMVRKLGLTKYGKVVDKAYGQHMDICFDDQVVQLANVNIKVR